jgi:hypothetical protein
LRREENIGTRPSADVIEPQEYTRGAGRTITQPERSPTWKAVSTNCSATTDPGNGLPSTRGWKQPRVLCVFVADCRHAEGDVCENIYFRMPGGKGMLTLRPGAHFRLLPEVK